MRINQNISAMNTYSRLTSANNSKSKSLEKLSSGLRINRAGDDAAGLAISEKMRGQIGGLNQSIRNAQDGISLIQTAEGALTETHSMLGRMRDLAVQSANGTNTADDRAEIQKEMDQLSQELSRIETDTEFNTQKLLDGSFKEMKFHIGANSNQNTSITIENMGAKELKVQGTMHNSQKVSGVAGLEIKSVTGKEVKIAYVTQTASGNAAVEKTTAKVSGDTIVVSLAQGAGSGNGPGTVATNGTDIQKAIASVAGDAGIVISKDATGTALTAAPNAGGQTFAAATWKLDAEASKKVGINVSNQDAANDAIKTIDDATAKVSSERSKLGAMQNRLDHTINNLTATSENLSAAESRIRDVDMAQEMMEFTKNNILSQAATSMLAQANQMPQSVLQLLQ